MGGHGFALQANPFVVAATLIFSVLYVPLLSEISRILLYCYFLGAWAKPLLMRRTDSSVVSSVVISVALACAIFLLVGMFIPVNTILARLLVAVSCAVLYLVRHKSSDQLKMPRKHLLIIIGFVLAPVIPVMILNPATGFISDGWWHYSLFQMAGGSSLPFPNPWLEGASAAYPYVYHVFMSALFGQTQLAPHIIFILANMLVSVALVCLAYSVARIYYSPIQSLWTSFTFYLVSTIGVIAFTWDFLRHLFTSTIIPGFTDYLYAHSGPHMYHAAMKFLPQLLGSDLTVGVNIMFIASLLVGSLQFFFMLACLYFYLREEYAVAMLAYAGVLSSNPVMGIIFALALVMAGLWQLRTAGKLPLATVVVGGLMSAVICGSYLWSLIAKLSHIAEGSSLNSTFTLLSVNGLWMLLQFIVGYSPLIYLAWLQVKEKRYPTVAVAFFTSFIFASLLVALFMQLGYLYASMALFFPLAFLAGPQFSKILTGSNSRRIVLTLVLVIGVGSSLLSSATYAYYTYDLDEDEVRASAFLRSHTDASAVVLADMGNLWSPGTSELRNIETYVSVFGGRQVYIADTWSLYVYGEVFEDQATAYTSFWNDPSCIRIPSGVTHIYTSSDISALVPCTALIYDEGGIYIYEVADVSSE